MSRISCKPNQEDKDTVHGRTLYSFSRYFNYHFLDFMTIMVCMWWLRLHEFKRFLHKPTAAKIMSNCSRQPTNHHDISYLIFNPLCVIKPCSQTKKIHTLAKEDPFIKICYGEQPFTSERTSCINTPYKLNIMKQGGKVNDIKVIMYSTWTLNREVVMMTTFSQGSHLLTRQSLWHPSCLRCNKACHHWSG